MCFPKSVIIRHRNFLCGQLFKLKLAPTLIAGPLVTMVRHAVNLEVTQGKVSICCCNCLSHVLLPLAFATGVVVACAPALHMLLLAAAHPVPCHCMVLFAATAAIPPCMCCCLWHLLLQSVVDLLLLVSIAIECAAGGICCSSRYSVCFCICVVILLHT